MTETTIDSFIQRNSAILARAFGCRRALPQLKLRWVERVDDDPLESQPDYLLERLDGYFDILDLKTASKSIRSITKGKKARLRFVDYVNEMIAQLKGYERYFQKEGNRLWALHKYKIRVDKPRLIGIVGNYDNFERDDVQVALEAFDDRICVLSYADLVAQIAAVDSGMLKSI